MRRPGFGGAQVKALPQPLVDLFGAFFLLLAGPVWLLAWWLRRRLTRQAWQRLADRPGPPLAYVQGFDDARNKIAAPPLVRQGAPARLRSLRTPLRRTPFDEFVEVQAAMHRPVVAVDARAPVSPPVGLRRVPIGHATTGQAWAYALVITAGPFIGDPAAVEAFGNLVVSHRDRPIAVVLPPWPPEQVFAQLTRWRTAMAGIAPFDELGEFPVSSGTLVVVHIPGRGWHAWAATERTVWAYIRALHDALAFASSQTDESTTPTAEPGPLDGHSRLRVVLINAGTDEQIVADLASGLQTLGLAVSRKPAADDPDVPAVVVLTRAALADPAWQSKVASLDSAGVRVIPVQAEDVDATAAPLAVADVNWIKWYGPGSARTLADVFAAVTADPGRYRLHRSLTGQARAWAAANRDPALLITDHRNAEEAADHVEAATGDGLARPSRLTREYVLASTAQAHWRRGGARKVWALGMTLVLAAASTIVFAWVTLHRSSADNRLVWLASSIPKISADRPDWAGQLAGALIVQGNDEQRVAARRTLRSMLDRSWPSSFIGAGHDAPFTDAVPVAGGVLTLDGRGSLTRWNSEDGSVRWRRQLTAIPTVLDTTPDASTIAAGSEKSLQLITVRPWRRDTVSLPSEVTRLAVIPAAKVVMVATTDGAVASIGLSAPHTRRIVGRYQAVLDVRRTAGGATSRAVVVTAAGRVALVDTTSRRVVSQARIPLPDDLTTSAGAVGAEGSTIAVQGDDRTLYVGTKTKPLHSTGAVIGEGTALAVLPRIQVIYSSHQYGTRVLDGRTEIAEGPFIQAPPMVSFVKASDDGRTVLISNGFGVMIWSASSLAPIGQPGTLAGLGTKAQASVDRTAIKGTADGTVVLTRPDAQPYRVRAALGAVSTVNLSKDGTSALVGSSRGEVAEIDVDDRAVVRRWQAPDGRPVTALGWSADPARLMVRTSGGIWWNPQSCAGCGSDGPLLAALRARLSGCVAEENLTGITDGTRRRLGLRVCEKSPQPEAG
ncbi:hypothetical protein AB0M20_19300 [Actinoplanes sp. NPDC051633]|uniref:hypothetical protein n=1 Tax=Actinoplanes sp. NPDC051633 TaxID=3155670 RepID=UPI0034450DF1